MLNPLWNSPLADVGSAAVFAGMSAVVLTIVVVAIFLSVFWIIELVDAARRQFNDDTTKVIWIVIILFTHVLGSIIYYFVGKKQGTLPGETRF